MRKLSLLATLLITVVALNAQNLVTSYVKAPGLQKPTNTFNVQKPAIKTNAGRSSTQAMISYLDDNLNDYAADTTGKRFSLGYTNINLRYGNNINQTYRNGMVFFDSLINLQATYPSQDLGGYAGKTVRVDSVDVYYFHNRTLTTKPDTLTVSVFNINQASISGTGANTVVTTPALWSQTLNATGTGNLNAQGIPVMNGVYLKTFNVNTTLPVGAPFGVRVDYQGDTANKFNLLTGYRNNCAGACLYSNSTVPGNSFGYINYTTTSAPVTNLSGYGLLGNDCDGNNTLEFATCELFYGDFWIVAYVTISTPTPPTVVTNAATNITSTSATLNGSINANSVSTQSYFDFGTTVAYGTPYLGSPATVTGTTTTPIAANVSNLQPNTTYHFRARGVNADGTTNGQDITFTTLAAQGVCTPAPGGSGFSPASSAIPCAINGQAFSQDISFIVPATILTYPVTSLKVDSIRNVPTGLTATLNQNPATYNGGTNGCYRISGTTNAACGQYKILFYVTITGGFGTQSGELSTLASTFGVTGYEPTFIRAVNQGVTCPAVNSAQTTNFVAISCSAPTITINMTKTDVICNTKGTAEAAPSGGTNYTYAWSNGSLASGVSGLNPGTYQVTVTDVPSGATATASVTINNTPNTLAATATAGTQPNCGQSNGTVSVSATGGTPAYTYSWNTNPAQNSATASNLPAGSYTATVTDVNGCTATATVNLSNPGAPTAAITGNNTICAGDTATLTATGGGTYAWSNSLGSNAVVKVNPTTATTYTVTVSNTNGCSATATVTVTVNQLPSPTITANGNALSTGAFSSYQWQLNGNNINGATSQNYTATQNGSYTVVVTDGNSCQATSAAQNVTGVSISDISSGFAVKLMPNPNNGTFKLEIGDDNLYDVTISNLIGEVVATAKVQKEHNFNLSDAAKGIYLVNIRKNTASKTLKFTLIK